MGLYEGSKGGGNVSKSGKVGTVPPDSGQNDTTADGARHVQVHHEHAAADHDAQATHHAAIADQHDALAGHHRQQAEYHRGAASSATAAQPPARSRGGNA